MSKKSFLSLKGLTLVEDLLYLLQQITISPRLRAKSLC
jgi:hypothetical protein